LLDLGAREFAAFCSITATAEGDSTRIEIELLPDAPQETVDEFLNFVLCAALEQQLSLKPDASTDVLR
jgi:hypothetical protein